MSSSQRKWRGASSRAVVAALTAGLIATAGVCSPQSASAAVSTPSVSAAFLKPGTDAKLMARMWFPDAGAGGSAEGLALVRKQINDMAAGGFGGVEVALIADTVSYTNADMKENGFGSPNWKRIVKELLTTANAVPGGFKVDFTITSHWPPIVNTIDPNDDQASQEGAVAYAKITQEALDAGSMDLPMADHLTKDNFNAPFAFVNKFSSATVGKVAAVSASGVPTFEVASLADVSGATSKKKVSAAEASAGTPYKLVKGVRYAGSAAGVPDEEYATANGIDYATVLEAFGPEPSDPGFSGKIDADGNRKRMADWEYTYRTYLKGIDALNGHTPSAGSGLAVGDYVLFGNYYHGTGQMLSGMPTSEPTQYNRPYVTNYFSSTGAKAVFDFWDANILDAEVVGLLKENGKLGTSIFEDSIEIHRQSPLWVGDLIDEMAETSGRDYSDYVPVLANTTLSFDATDQVTRLREDYNLTLGRLYEDEHAAPIKKWAASFGYTYRAQGYALPGLDVGAAAAALDVPEGDNSSAGDGLRQLTGSVNLTGKKMLSMEAVTFSANMNSPWVTVEKELNSNYSDGVNRAILHGSAFARSFNGHGSAWPGWNFVCCGLNMGFTSMNARQIWWDEVGDFSDYAARIQAVLQAGTAKVDLGVLVGSDVGYSLQSGNSLRSLMDKGYSYNLLTEPLLAADSAKVSGGVLAADGPAYKAIVVKQAKRLSVATVNKLIEFAKAGLPVILYGVDLERVYGTSHGSNTDAKLAAALTELKKLANVSSAPTEAEIAKLLKAEDVTPAASYSIANLQVSRRHGSDGEFYYLYNDSTNQAVSGKVSLTGSGNPYVLDAVTGEISPIGEYDRSGGKVTVEVSLPAQGSTIIALATGSGLPSPAKVWATEAEGEVVVDAKGRISLVVDEPGSYPVKLSDGSTRTVEVADVEDPVALTEGWDLSLESWGPDAEANAVDPTASKQTTVEFDDIALRSWSTLATTGDQLAKLDVASMARVSGIGTYSRSFELPSTWDAADTATLKLAHGADMITSVAVNGNRIDSIDQYTNEVKIGQYLKAGANSIEIKLDTPLGNRGFNANAAYGLTGVTIVPGVATSLIEKATSGTTLSVPAKLAFGQAGKATVVVTGKDGTPAAGEVKLAVGSVQLSAQLVNGKAGFDLPRNLAVGTVTIIASYAGDDEVKDSSATAKLTVVKATVGAKFTTVTKPTSKKTGKATVTVTSKVGGPTAPTGTVKVAFKKSGKSTKYASAKISAGKATITIPKLAKGTWKVYVSYSGDTGYLKLGYTQASSIKVTK